MARLQRFFLLAQFLAAAAWLLFWWQRGRPGLGMVGAVLILFAHAVLMAGEFSLLRWVNRCDAAAPPPTTALLLRAWVHEAALAVLVFAWRQPFCWNTEPDHLPADDATGRRGVLFVHGFVCNRGFWNPWMTRLRSAQVPFVAPNLEPVFASIEAYVALIDVAVTRLTDATGLAPVVVAHSMGGLAVRAWMCRAPGADERVAHVITIGTPHRGTWLGRFGRAPNTRQMRLASPWLADLCAREPVQRWARFTCFYSHCDNVVFPASTATLPGANNRHLPGLAHAQMAHHPAVFEELLRCLNALAAVQPGTKLRSPGRATPAAMAGSPKTSR
jgi:pimeloyl-ACP methyl ester carboxylesterase